MPSHLRRVDESGHVHFLTISCFGRMPFFRLPHIRDLVVDAMGDARTRIRFRWIGYVIMPEHVHWLIYPQGPGAAVPIPIGDVLESLKGSIGKRVKAAWRPIWAQEGTLGHTGMDRWATDTGSARPIWTPRGIDFNVLDYPRLLQKLDYCHNNPIKRGLIERPEQWPWSSYTHYEGGATPLLKMDWDGGWPLE